MYNLEISGKDAENTSSHVKVSAMLRINCAEGTVKTKLNLTKSIKKLKWEKMDKCTYIQSLENVLVKTKHNEPASVDQRLTKLTTVIHKATERAVPTAVIKLKGPKWKASNSLKCVNKSINYGRLVEKTDNILRKDNIMAKR